MRVACLGTSPPTHVIPRTFLALWYWSVARTQRHRAAAGTEERVMTAGSNAGCATNTATCN